MYDWSQQGILVRDNNGVVRPYFSKAPLLSSVFYAWDDIIRAEYYHLESAEYSEAYIQRHAICIQLSQPFFLEWKIDNENWQQRLITPESVHILTSGTLIAARSQESAEILVLYLNPSFVVRTADEFVCADDIKFANTFGVPDSRIKHIGLAFYQELETGYRNDRLYGESLATALTVHLLREYLASSKKLPESEDGLCRHKLKQVVEYINANLDRQIGVCELASIAGISIYYFCRQFKQSTGLSPHKYINQKRIERAKQLLITHEMTLSDIALECGFYNHSHFTKLFRQFTGTTPKAYREKN